jgi:extracellular factor (EF) 3-hydroxypalmitic acid methyl ester biosynthesis protein
MTTCNVESGGVHSPNGEIKDSLVVGQTSHGIEIHGTLLRLTPFLAVFEVYVPALILRTSEVLNDFKIVINDRPVYSGRAVISSLVNAGVVLVCEVSLGDFWLELDAFWPGGKDGKRANFQDFLQHWQKIYKIRPEFKVVVADMQIFLTDLRLWLEQVELGIRSAPAGSRLSLEQEMASELGLSTTPALTNLFEKFENTLQEVEPEYQPAHQTFGRRQLHPMLLCSPFLYRCFSKPLGYAGDYEMVNMIMRDPLEGGSLYAKIVNLWFLRQPPAEAHRNRIQRLMQYAETRTARAVGLGRTARILSVGCGSAHEVQQFLRDKPLADRAQFTLMDFNEETLAHCRTILEEVKKKCRRTTPIRYVKKSVQQILKGAARSVERAADEQYDLIYCAGLYDYLSDPVCRKLANICYEWLAPGGLLIATNVDVSNPRRITMDYIMEWHLTYRRGTDLLALKPGPAPADLCAVRSDSTGVNLYFEAQKPDRA